MKTPFWVLENTPPDARKHLFTSWGVEWLATRYSWLSILTFVIAALVGKLSTVPFSWGTGLVSALLLYSPNIVHSLGHMLTGHLIGSPKQSNMLTATLDVNLYTGDQSNVSARVHLGRALGGPLFNPAIGLMSLILWQWLGASWLVMAGYIHLVRGLCTLLPIAPMDGWVVWRYARPYPQRRG